MAGTLRVNVSKVQAYLQENDLDGWLIYDFRGLNPVATSIVQLGDHFFSRRWLYFIPKSGQPAAIVHKIENAIFPQLPGRRLLYAGWVELEEQLTQMLDGTSVIAMEYSPENAIPTISFVDAGTIEMIRKLDVDVVSSANLVQYFTCRLSSAQVASHKKAVEVLHETQKLAFAEIEQHLQQDRKITEYDVQRFIMSRLQEHGLVSMADAIVAVNSNASNPHYAPTAEQFTQIRKGDCILIDLWAKQDTPEAVYGDITWVGFAGKNPPPRYREIFEVVRDGRELAVTFLQQAAQKKRAVQGYQVDEVVRNHISGKGYGDYFFHRTGHSIDEHDHGKGVNIDSYETRDLREIVPGLLFSIEPGIYLPEFGVRTEIDVYFSEQGPEVFTPRQQELILLDV